MQQFSLCGSQAHFSVTVWPTEGLGVQQLDIVKHVGFLCNGSKGEQISKQRRVRLTSNVADNHKRCYKEDEKVVADPEKDSTDA